MHKIISPLQLGSQGPEVANLQDALLLLIDKGIIQMSAADRQALKSLLSQEKQVQSYTDGTAKAVTLFQGQHQLERTGGVDEPTANALNRLLDELSGTEGESPAFMVRSSVAER
jgi:peptidoglycan hydrolase-like protein with peptidoglycan-binding domain